MFTDFVLDALKTSPVPGRRWRGPTRSL